MTSIRATLLLALPLTIVAHVIRTPFAFRAAHVVADAQDQITLLDDPPAPTRSAVVWATPTTVARPRSQAAFHEARRRSLEDAQSTPIEWDEVDVLAPDVTDQATILELAYLTGNAYFPSPDHKDWYELDPRWNNTPVGWPPNESESAVRGHIFASTDNATIVISLKGTTLPFTGPTSGEDRRNDNLLFSCCCARVNFKWAGSTVCGCYDGGNRCDTDCLERALTDDSIFYSFGINLYNNITYLYPDATIWLVGHSLGGGLASLIGTTFGAPTVTFEAPGERRAAARLHLPALPAHILPATTHLMHTADPVPYGVCTGWCARAGYALETRCHLGRVIEYDTVRRLHWTRDVRKHPIRAVIEGVLELPGPWPDGDVEHVGAVPEARAEVDCEDCYKWEFGDFGRIAASNRGAVLPLDAM